MKIFTVGAFMCKKTFYIVQTGVWGIRRSVPSAASVARPAGNYLKKGDGEGRCHKTTPCKDSSVF